VEAPLSGLGPAQLLAGNLAQHLPFTPSADQQVVRMFVHTAPKAVRERLRLVQVEKLDLSRVKKEDIEVIEYLKASHPDLYRNLRKAVKGRRRKPEAAPEHASE